MIRKWNCLERQTEGGESPVHGRYDYKAGLLSSAEPEKLCVNLPAPSGKAKYYRETDSELVP